MSSRPLSQGYPSCPKAATDAPELLLMPDNFVGVLPSCVLLRVPVSEPVMNTRLFPEKDDP